MNTVSRRSLIKASLATAAVTPLGSMADVIAQDPGFNRPVRHIENIRKFYSTYSDRVAAVRKAFGRPLTMAEKVLYAHLYDISAAKPVVRGKDYAYFRPDHLIMQDLLAQTAMLQFMVAGFPKVTLPTSIHCDHLTLAHEGAKADLTVSDKANKVVYDFLRDVSDKYGCDFWKPGAGIIHQETLENYAYPGALIVGCDSHTPNGSGLGGMAIGVGGADAVDCMSGMEWELLAPKVIGVKLTGSLQGWTTAKDIILRVLGILSVKGGTNAVIEYFGPGVDTISATGKATIGNMGAELGATSSVFPFDANMVNYLCLTGRKEVAEMATKVSADLRADQEVYAAPDKFYDRVIEIDLDKLEPQISGPFSPDANMKLSDMKKNVQERHLSDTVEASLIGSCTNSSYEDITRATALAQQAYEAGLKPKCPMYLAPGSNLIKATMDRDGLTQVYEKLGVTILANACGPCVGMWARLNNPKRKNTIVAAFNRNFKSRNDRNPLTESFLVSPDMAVAYAFSGSLSFNPLTDTITTPDGKAFKFHAVKGQALPAKGYARAESGCLEPTFKTKEIVIAPNNGRIAMLTPFEPWDRKDMVELPLLMKVKGKCTTDHICPGRIEFVGNIPKMSEFTLSVATNAFVPDRMNAVWNQVSKSYDTVYNVAMAYKNQHGYSVIVGDENYGEGSSREQAALQPRFLNVKAIIARSFARIHETNLKKQGILALTFVKPADYDKIQEKDKISIVGLNELAPGKQVKVILTHEDGSKDEVLTQHSYNERQLEWFRYGSALNMLREQRKAA